MLEAVLLVCSLACLLVALLSVLDGMVGFEYHNAKTGHTVTGSLLRCLIGRIDATLERWTK